MSIKLREAVPIRSIQIPEETNYRRYREALRSDFNQRCGYCDDSDKYTDPISFHIDHFAPKSRFPALETTYSNLVYACRFCNVNKKNTWIGNSPSVPNNGSEGFVDPCSEEYDDHLERTSEGKIIPKTPLGNFIHVQLKLYLLRHEYLWKSRLLRKRRKEIENSISKLNKSDQIKFINEYERLFQLIKEIEKYDELARNSTS